MQNFPTKTLSVALIAATVAAMALAQTADPHAGHTMPMADDSPATAAFAALNARMHEEMNISYTGNPDVDFIRGMIPHHQGAVDAARVVLEYGTDPEVRAFAEAVIAAQEAEIAWMTDWLARQPAE